MKQNYFIKKKLREIALDKYLKKRLKSAGYIDSDIKKTPLSTRIVLYALIPGLVIGKKGTNIRKLTADIEKKFDFNKVHIEIGDMPNKDLDPKVIIEKIANDIERGISWKRAVYKALNKMKRTGAIGGEIIAKGNIGGKGQRKRKSRFYFGYLKKAGDQKKLVGCEKKTTFPTLGTIGITVKVVTPGTIFSDKIDVKELAKQYKQEIEEEKLEKEQEKVEENTKDAAKKVEKKKEKTNETKKKDTKTKKETKKKDEKSKSK